MPTDPVEREQLVLSLLDSWPWEFGGSIIGGYAIDAYGRPRYSDDVDIVVPSKSVDDLKSWLSEHGFKIVNYNIPNPQNYDGRTFRYIKGEITLDLLAGCVRDRDAQIDIPEEWITHDCRSLKLFLLSGSTTNEVPVARSEALWALKLQAGRDQDITDLFSIMQVPVKATEVKELFKNLWTETLALKLDRTLKKTREKKLYEDSMSRLAMKQNERSKKDWQRFQNIVEAMILQV